MRKIKFVFFLLISSFILNNVSANTLNTEPPAVGSEAPTFKLTSNEGKEVELKSFRKKWVVLYFYPKNFTGGCTLEARNFQKDIEKYEQSQAVILGVSLDSADSHKEFCAKEGLSFKLLSDIEGKVSTEYGSLNERNGNKMSARNTFIIDPKGKIAKVFTGVKPAAHSEEVLAALAELQSQYKNKGAKAKS